jgi:hypothetical protein
LRTPRTDTLHAEGQCNSGGPIPFVSATETNGGQAHEEQMSRQ